MTYKRLQFNELQSRINEARGKIQVIVGPRQVGKTTLIGQVLDECSILFESVYACWIKFFHMDKLVTILYKVFAPYCVNKNREFFDIKPEQALYACL